MDDLRLVHLRERLLTCGGEWIRRDDAQGNDVTEDLLTVVDELLSTGRFWSTDRASAKAGEKNACHKNAYTYYSQHAKTYSLVTGFALGRSLWVLY